MRPTAAALSLPIFSPEIPLEIKLGDGAGPVTLARELLRLGVIRDSDWNDNFQGTITHGMTRFLNVEMGLENLHMEGWRFTYSDNLAKVYESFPSTGGFFFYMNGPSRYFYVGQSIEAIESLAKGAGYSVFHALKMALDVTLRAWGPPEAYDDLISSDYYESILMDEWDVSENLRGKKRRADLMGTPSLLRLTRHMPQAVIKPEWKNGAVKRALKKVPHDSKTARALEIALELHELWPDNTRRRLDATYDCTRHLEDCFHIVEPILLLWQQDDCIQQIFDDVCELAYQAGDTFGETLMLPFDMGSPESIAEAVENLRLGARTMLLIDELLSYLETDGQAFKTYRATREAVDNWNAMFSSETNEPQSLLEVLGDVGDDGQAVLTEF